MHVYIYTCAYTYIYIYIHIYIYIYIYIHMCMHKYIYIYIYMQIYIHTYVYKYIYICMYVLIYIYIKLCDMFDYVLTNDHIFVSLYICVCEWYSQFDFARMERCQKWSLVLCCQRRVFAQTWTFRKDSCQWFVMSTRIKKNPGLFNWGVPLQKPFVTVWGITTINQPGFINPGLTLRGMQPSKPRSVFTSTLDLTCFGDLGHRHSEGRCRWAISSFP